MKSKSVKIKTKDGFELDGVFIGAGEVNKAVILAHGMTVDRDDEGIFVKAEPELNKLGISTLRFDFRVHGKSQGDSVKDFTISGELKDLEATFQFLQKKGVKQIGLAGASFGGGIAALYAGKLSGEIEALFLANPALDYEKCFLNPTTPWAKEHFENVFERIKEKGFIKIGSRKFKVGIKPFEEMKQYNPCRELKKYQGPIFMAYGRKDSKVAYQDAVDCFNILPNKNRRLESLDSEHGFHDEPYQSQVAKMICEFFKEELA